MFLGYKKVVKLTKSEGMIKNKFKEGMGHKLSRVHGNFRGDSDVLLFSWMMVLGICYFIIYTHILQRLIYLRESGEGAEGERTPTGSTLRSQP